MDGWHCTVNVMAVEGRGASEAVLFDGSTSVRYPCTSTRTRSIVAKGS